MIISSRKDPGSFFLMDQHAARNSELPYDSLGMLAYLVMHPTGWKVYEADLVRAHAEAKQFKVRRMLRDLRRLGYAVLYRMLYEGKVVEWEIAVWDNPKDNPHFDPAESPDERERKWVTRVLTEEERDALLAMRQPNQPDEEENDDDEPDRDNRDLDEPDRDEPHVDNRDHINIKKDTNIDLSSPTQAPPLAGQSQPQKPKTKTIETRMPSLAKRCKAAAQHNNYLRGARWNRDGFIEPDTGTNIVQIYYERFEILQQKEKLSMPLIDDMRRRIITAAQQKGIDEPTMLAMFREVVRQYAASSYGRRNINLICDWFEYPERLPEYKMRAQSNQRKETPHATQIAPANSGGAGTTEEAGFDMEAFRAHQQQQRNGSTGAAD